MGSLVCSLFPIPLDPAVASRHEEDPDLALGRKDHRKTPCNFRLDTPMVGTVVHQVSLAPGTPGAGSAHPQNVLKHLANLRGPSDLLGPSDSHPRTQNIPLLRRLILSDR